MSARLAVILAVAMMAHAPCDADTKSKRHGTTPAQAPTETLAAANAQARRTPAVHGFIDAAQIYDFAPGALYELYAAPEFLSTILLEEGETLKTTAAGDTTRWMVEQASAAGDNQNRTLVLVKPTRAGIRTNIVLVTDRRTYLVEVIALENTGSRVQTYSAQIAWRYPASSSAKTSSTALVELDALDFGYRIRAVKGRKPAWFPLRVFNDGRRTYVEFPPAMETSAAPPLFRVGPEGAELVNYRVDGRRYVVDQLLDAAELRLGNKRPTVVRIERTGASQEARR